MLKRWVAVGLVALATLGLAGLSMADVPNETNSSVTCECIPDAGTGIGSGRDEAFECTICPGGDKYTEDIWVHVVVRNIYSAPLGGSQVTVSSVGINGEVLRWDDGVLPAGDTVEDPQTALSAGDGTVSFMFDEGGIQQLATTTFPNLDFNVLMVGPGPGSATKTCDTKFEVVGYDHNISGIVDLADLIVFGTQGWVSQDLECDYNHTDGAVPVTLLDFVMFASSWGHKLDNQ